MNAILLNAWSAQKSHMDFFLDKIKQLNLNKFNIEFGLCVLHTSKITTKPTWILLFTAVPYPCNNVIRELNQNFAMFATDTNRMLKLSSADCSSEENKCVVSTGIPKIGTSVTWVMKIKSLNFLIWRDAKIKFRNVTKKQTNESQFNEKNVRVWNTMSNFQKFWLYLSENSLCDCYYINRDFLKTLSCDLIIIYYSRSSLDGARRRPKKVLLEPLCHHSSFVQTELKILAIQRLSHV